MELQPNMIYFNWWIWRVTNDPASGARISFKETSFSTVQQELYSRMAAWTGQKGLGDGRLYGIKSRRCFADGSHIQEGKMLLGDFQLPCWSNTLGSRCHSTIFNPLSCKSLELHFSMEKISKCKTVDERFFETSKCTVWLKFMARFFQRNLAFLQETCISSIFEESLYHQVDLTNQQTCQGPADEKVGKGCVFFFLRIFGGDFCRDDFAVAEVTLCRVWGTFLAASLLRHMRLKVGGFTESRAGFP